MTATMTAAKTNLARRRRLTSAITITPEMSRQLLSSAIFDVGHRSWRDRYAFKMFSSPDRPQVGVGSVDLSTLKAFPVS
jgi:hypothetical protein